MGEAAGISSGAVVAAANLRVDAVTVEVVEALRGRDLEPILLKGPTLAHWLGPDAARPYADCDLLVEQRCLEDAGAVLAGLGFARHMAGADVGDLWTHPAWMWSRSGAHVDLHHSLAGSEAAPDVLWTTLRDRTKTLRRGHTELAILEPRAAACVLALHAAQHGVAGSAPLRDLELALNRFERAIWDDAASIADQLAALPAFVAGLRLLPTGSALVSELELDADPTVEVALSSASAPKQAFTLEQLARRPGMVAKAEFIRGRLMPPPEWMRAHYPLARRGKAGLVTAHAWRFLSAPARLVPATRAWRRARREAGV